MTIEFFGWATVSDSTSESSVNATEAAFVRIKPRLDALRVSGRVMVSDGWLNGEPRLVLTGAANHPDQFREVLDLFRLIGKEAPGSYGLLSVHDDEDARRGNDFVTWVLARGSVESHTDTLLSPVVPTIADP